MEDKAIAIFDILGFGNFVNKNRIENVLYSYEALLASTHKAKEIIDNSNIKIMVYSDTIAIIDENFIDKSIYNLTYICSLLLCTYFQSLNSVFPLLRPIRGAICIGEYIYKNSFKWRVRPDVSPLIVDNINMLVGKAIVEGYEWEKSQKWIGVSYSKESKYKLENIYQNVLNKLINENLLVKYSVPLKNERLETYAVNCLIDIVPVKIVNKIRSIEHRFSHEISIKYKNTRIFLEYLLENSILIKKVD